MPVVLEPVSVRQFSGTAKIETIAKTMFLWKIYSSDNSFYESNLANMLFHPKFCERGILVCFDKAGDTGSRPLLINFALEL